MITISSVINVTLWLKCTFQTRIILLNASVTIQREAIGVNLNHVPREGLFLAFDFLSV